jgi:hypothetical protein
MAIQPNTGPGLPFWGFVTIMFLQGCIVGPAPNPQPRGPGLRIYDPGDRVAQLYPQALGIHFIRLLRHAWVTVGLFSNPGHHTGDKERYGYENLHTVITYFKTSLECYLQFL